MRNGERMAVFRIGLAQMADDAPHHAGIGPRWTLHQVACDFRILLAETISSAEVTFLVFSMLLILPRNFLAACHDLLRYRGDHWFTRTPVCALNSVQSRWSSVLPLRVVVPVAAVQDLSISSVWTWLSCNRSTASSNAPIFRQLDIVHVAAVDREQRSTAISETDIGLYCGCFISSVTR